MNDVELLDATLAHIEAHPETWEQQVFRCKTGMCFAGWVCTLAGGRWAYPETGPDADLLVAEPDDPDDDVWQINGLATVFVSRRARRLLGLTSEDPPLFRADNQLEDIREYVAEIKDRKAAKS